MSQWSSTGSRAGTGSVLSPSIWWMSLLQSFIEFSLSSESSFILFRYLRVFRCHCPQFPRSWAFTVRFSLIGKVQKMTQRRQNCYLSVPLQQKSVMTDPCRGGSSYLSLRLSFMDMVSSLMGRTSGSLSSCRLIVLAVDFTLPMEPNLDLELPRRLLAMVDDFLRYRRDW